MFSKLCHSCIVKKKKKEKKKKRKKILCVNPAVYIHMSSPLCCTENTCTLA